VGAVVAMVAAQRVGCPFLLLDTSSPHLGWTCERANCSIVIYDESSLWLEQVDDLLLCQKNIVLYRIQDLFHEHDLTTKDEIVGQVYSPILYLMETSGSSGDPNLVQCPVVGSFNRIQWQLKEFPYERTEVALAKTSLAFVDCVAEIFAPLTAGIPLVVLDDRQPQSDFSTSRRLNNAWRDPRLVLKACQKYQVTRLVVTPTFLLPFWLSLCY
jgi:non-ribosomal peptide synthetase component F